jgi:hypothetical protein
MTAAIEVDGVLVVFTLDPERKLWHCSEEQPEGAFPLVTSVRGKRYLLYSDGTFAEVER